MKEEIRNESINDGSGFNTVYTNCKFIKYDIYDYVSCDFINCTFPNDPVLGEIIFGDTNNDYIKCSYNLDKVLKKLLVTTNGLTDIINSFNKYLNKTDKSQIVDIGKIKNTNSLLVEV